MFDVALWWLRCMVFFAPTWERDKTCTWYFCASIRKRQKRYVAAWLARKGEKTERGRSAVVLSPSLRSMIGSVMSHHWQSLSPLAAVRCDCVVFELRYLFCYSSTVYRLCWIDVFDFFLTTLACLLELSDFSRLTWRVKWTDSSYLFWICYFCIMIRPSAGVTCLLCNRSVLRRERHTVTQALFEANPGIVAYIQAVIGQREVRQIHLNSYLYYCYL